MTDQRFEDGRDDESQQPVEVGTGAAAGGVSGAAIGSAGGPVGAGIGAVIGAAAGGVAGSARGQDDAAGDDWKWDDERLRGLIGYKVVDRDDEKIGTVSAVWEDSRGEPAFLGVKTGWLGMGRSHIVPAHSADWSPNKQAIRLPFSVQVVKDAPTFDEDEQIDHVAESRIYTYYREHGFTMHAGDDQPPTTAMSDAYSQPGEETAQPVDAPAADTTLEPRSSEERSIPLREEELVVGKREVEAGGVRLRKIVRTEIVNQPVEVMREDVVIERVPAGGATTTESTGETFAEEEIYIPLRREEAVVGKRARTREEVRVRTTEQVESQQVSETLRSEDVEVEREVQEPGRTGGDGPGGRLL
ncbi:MAG TPA: PRC and DUF2382 domain-containing protein [Planctomycetota bacterium]|nr:PRC and DUF2382 domain-containing protein [Planctomycetota bacterium]